MFAEQQKGQGERKQNRTCPCVVQPGYGGYNQSQQQQVVMINQPAPMGNKGLIPPTSQGREWSTGMCGCFEDCCGCVYGCFCFPCFLCTLAAEMDECQLGPCCFGHLFMIPMRTRIRAVYDIRGSICKDLCAMTFCEFCTAQQMHREIKNRKNMA